VGLGRIGGQFIFRPPNVCAEFGLFWVRAVLAQSARRWYASPLSIGSHGRAVKLGRFLINDEQEALVTALINVIKKNR